MDGRIFLPTVAWSFKVRDVIFLTPGTVENPATFRCTAIPFDSSDPGANTGTKEIGFYVTDNVGNIYTVIGTGTHTVDLSDDFRCGVGPQTGKWAVLSKSVGNGEAPFLTPIHYRRLDKSAIDNVRRIELDILYHKKVTIHADSSLIATIDENQVLKIITTETYPPVTIDPDSVNLAEIGEDQILRIIPPISNSNKFGILEGGIVTWLYGLTFSVSLTRYYIDGILYACPSTVFTLDAADVTNPRIDVPTVTILGTLEVVKGIPAKNPLQPSIDVATQLELPFILLPANATEPVGVTDAIVYDENIEWTSSAFGVTVDFNNATSPFHGVKCASIGTIGNNDAILFTSLTPLTVEDYETLSFFLKLKAAASTKNAVYIQFRLNGVAITQELPISWLITDITNWQNIALKLSDFTFNQSTFDAIRIRWSRVQPNTTTHAGFYLDYIKLQTGLTAPEFIDTIELIGDITGKGKTGIPIETTLKDVITAGTFGGATKTLTLTVDAKGRVTSVTENTISGTGLDGREVELSTSGDYIVWRYVGETIWNNLVLLSSLQGPAGTDGTNGTNGANGNDGLTPFVGGNGNWWIGTTDTGIAAQGNSSLPATIDSTTTNSDNGTTHTHELGQVAIEGVIIGSPVEYGALYNWYAATDSKKITSSDDWVVPSFSQFETLQTYLGGWAIAGGKLKETGLTHWQTPNTGATNEVGFNGRGAGRRYYTGGFGEINGSNFIVTSDSASSTMCRAKTLQFNSLNFSPEFSYVAEYKKAGFSIRLLYVGTGTPSTYTGNDGKLYPVVLIGTQYWVSCNLNETEYRDGSWISGFDGGIYTSISDADWASRGTSGESLMCYYSNNEAYGGGQTPLSNQHNSLAGLNVGDYKHLTAAELAKVQAPDKDWITLICRDVIAGTADSIPLNLKAYAGYTIDSLTLQTDNGTLTVTVKINGTAITGLSAISATTTITETSATALKTVAVGDLVTIEWSTAYTGTPTMIYAELNMTR